MLINRLVVAVTLALLLLSTVPVQADEQPTDETPAETPERSDRGPRVIPDGYGDAIDMALPEQIRKDMRDQAEAIARMRLYFDGARKDRPGVALEFEDMYTAAPVIYAAFKADESDHVLSYEEWRGRDGGYVDLEFDIKTLPDRLKGFEVGIVQRHLRGDQETRLLTFQIPSIEPGERWEPVRLPGALPGVNRYTLEITYTDGQGQTTKAEGFSHWVVVQAPPMFGFKNEVTVEAVRLAARGQIILVGDLRMRAEFLPHHGLSPEDCVLRISRRGRRELNLQRLAPDVRRAVICDRAPPGWHELGRIPVKDGVIGDQRVTKMDGAKVIADLGHSFAAGSATLPLHEEWEYRFELQHRGARHVLAEWTVRIKLRIEHSGQIEAAAIEVSGTNMKTQHIPFRDAR